jgi:hypothetical protein
LRIGACPDHSGVKGDVRFRDVDAGEQTPVDQVRPVVGNPGSVDEHIRPRIAGEPAVW